MKRRTWVQAATGLALPWPRVHAQRALPRVAQVGILGPALQRWRAENLIAGLEPLGWKSGRNLHVETRIADAPALIDAHAGELVRQRVDVMVALLAPHVLAARRATGSVPIVMAGVGMDPVTSGLARSLAEPGGNITGMTLPGSHLAGKSLEIASEWRLTRRRVGALLNANDPFSGPLQEGLRQAAAVLRVELAVSHARSPAEYPGTLAQWAGAGVGAVFVQPSLAIDRVAELLLAHKLPSFSFTRGFVTAGGLLAYAASTSELQRRSVDYVDRILRGADPGGLAIEQSSNFDLLINLRTARALDLEVPRALMLRASEVLS